MRVDEFASLLGRIQKDEVEVRRQGQEEYARDDNNCFGNFDRLSDVLKLDRKVVWSVLAGKHWDGILSYIAGNKSQREDVRRRIKDLRMYLALLWGMIDEEEGVCDLSGARRTATTAAHLSRPEAFRNVTSSCGRSNCTGCPECEG